MPAAGVDVGGTKMLGVVLGARGEVRHEVREPTPRGTEAFVDALLSLVGRLADHAGDLSAVGVGVPGLVDRSGTLRFAPNLPGVVEVPVRRLVADRIGVEVRVDNDATCAAWAEHELGAMAGESDAVLVTLGTGIGGGIIADGEVLRGANGFAGEIGHMVVDAAGVACPCGRRGCWERYASGSGLGRMGREAVYRGRAAAVLAMAGGDPEDVRGEHVTRAALDGDADALEVLGELARWLALGLANIVNVLDCRLVVVGGGLVEAGEALLGPTRAAFADRLVAPDHRPPVRIEAASLGEHAGAVGAALLAAGDVRRPGAQPAGR